MDRKKIIVIGAGAAGLMAACAAADAGAEVTVIEHNEKAGKKIFITGKGRCNYSNACEDPDFFGNVLRNPKFLYSAVYGFDQSAMTEFLHENGCATKVERGNRCFPESDHAFDVTDALVRHLREKGGKIRLWTEVKRILTAEGENGAIRAAGVQLADGSKIAADAVIVATGGLSYPSTGSTGDGYRFASSLGLDVKPQVPSLVPLTVEEKWPLELQGLALKNIAVKLECLPERVGGNHSADNACNNDSGHNGASLYGVNEPGKCSAADGKTKNKRKGNKKKQKPVYEGFGEMLFTHFGVSGPLILSASCHADFAAHPEGYLLHLDLKPALTQEELDARLHREFEKTPKKELRNVLRTLLPERMAEVVAELFSERENGETGGRKCSRALLSDWENRDYSAETDPSSAQHKEHTENRTVRNLADVPVNTLNERQIRDLAAFLKDVTMHVTGTRGFNEAIITKGGVSVKEINPSTMECKSIPGLYFAGEVLDVDAYTGGFNLQIAWSTGHLAGESAAEEI